MDLGCVSLIVSYDLGLDSVDGYAAVSLVLASYVLHS